MGMLDDDLAEGMRDTQRIMREQGLSYEAARAKVIGDVAEIKTASANVADIYIAPPTATQSLNAWLEEQADILGDGNDGFIEKSVAAELARTAVYATINLKATLIGNLVNECHGTSRRAGWYNDPRTGAELPRNVGEMLALIHSEVSEALEAYRKDLMDDKLPTRKGIEVELADAVIRIFDLAGYLGLDLGGAYVEKRAYNETRADHRPENRAKAGGKAF